MNVYNSNSEKGLSATNWIALGGLVVASLTCYFSFCSDGPEPKPVPPTIIEVKPQMNQTVNVGVPAPQSETKLGNQNPTNMLPVSKPTSEQIVETKPIKKNEKYNSLISETDEFMFAIKECKRQGENVQVYLTVISKGKDRKLGIATNGQQGATKMYDENNSEYIINKIKIANNSSREGGGSINQILIRDVPTKVILMFSDVNENAQFISLLAIGCYFDFDPLNFRNIPIGYKTEAKTITKIEATQDLNNLKYDNDDYTFAINECKRQGENLQIKLSVTSKGKDRKLGIATIGQQKATTIFDNFNNEYVVQQIKIANETSRFGGGSINRILIKNIPTSVSFLFSGISTDATSVSLLNIGCYYDFDPIQFRKIHIE